MSTSGFLPSSNSIFGVISLTSKCALNAEHVVELGYSDSDGFIALRGICFLQCIPHYVWSSTQPHHMSNIFCAVDYHLAFFLHL